MDKIKNKKAQALVEFVLILPILIIMIFAIIDFGNIYVAKSNLENKMIYATEVLKNSIEVSSLYDEVKASVNKDSKDKILVELVFEKDTDLVKVKLSKSVNIITPGLNLILGSKYNATAERVVVYVK